MKSISKYLAGFVAGLIAVAGLAWAGGIYQGYPAITLPFTGSETFAVDTNLTGGQTPQTELITVDQLSIYNTAPSAIAQGSGTIAPSLATENFYTMTLTGTGANILSTPTGITAGQIWRLAVAQDSTGSRTMNYVGMFKFAGGTTPTLTTTALGVDLLTFVCPTTIVCYGTSLLNLR